MSIIVSSPNIVKMDEDTSMSQLENSSMVASFILFYNPMHRDQNMTNDRGGKGRNIVCSCSANIQNKIGTIGA